MKKTSKTTLAPICLCGCGGTTKGGRFLPGHDAKLKKALVDAALGGSKRAANKLEGLGWTKFLDAKRSRQSEKQEMAPPREKTRTRFTPTAAERTTDPTTPPDTALKVLPDPDEQTPGE